jgi:KDO2-lipid IV(A) lauroyltransferase
VTDEISPVRNAEGEIEVQATTQAIAMSSKAWVLRAPLEQWLWLASPLARDHTAFFS